jgi:hypothetical protein
MVSYEYTIVQQRGTAIELQITDSSAINPLLDRLSIAVPGFGASASKLPGGAPYHWRLCGLSKDMERVWGVIVEHFRVHGWTLLDDHPASGENGGRSMCFGLLHDTQDRERAQEPALCMEPA